MIIAKNSFLSLKEKMDPRGNNGGFFLGLNGLVIKSHGGADATSFSKAIELKKNYAEAHHNKGALLNQMGRFKEANEEFNKAIAIASPIIKAIVVELVGAKFNGQASFGFLNKIAWSDFLYRALFLLEEILKIGILNLFA